MRGPANVPNLRFTKSIQPWYSQLVVENRCSGVVPVTVEKVTIITFSNYLFYEFQWNYPTKEFAEFVNNYACVKLCLF